MNKIILFALLILCLSLVACNIAQDVLEREAHYNRGVDYLENGDIENAISEFNIAIEIYPQDAWAYNYRGQAYFTKGEYDQALADFDRAIEMWPEFPEALLARGICLSETGEKKRAIADLEKAIELELPLEQQEEAEKLLDKLSQ